MTEHIKKANELVRAIISRPGMFLKRSHDLEEIACMMHGFDVAGTYYGKCGQEKKPSTFTRVFHAHVMDLYPKEGSAMGWAHIITSVARREFPPDPMSKCVWEGAWDLFKQVFDEFEELHP